jgi:TRAP-type mannitol/chloroaromatic compound transport system permease large subunit
MGEMPYYLLGIAFFAIMGCVLYRAAIAKEESL